MTADDELDPQQDAVRELLAAEPSPTMPPEVRTRLMAAIAAESQTRESAAQAPVSLADRRRTPRWILPTAVAAAMVLLAGIVLVPMLRSGPTSTSAEDTGSTCGIVAQPGADMTSVAHDAGTPYSAAGLETQSQSLLSAAPACPAGENAAAAPDVTQQYRESDGPTAYDAPEDTWSADEVSECLLDVVPGAEILVFDQAEFEGEPAVVAVVDETPQRAVAVDCGVDPAELVAETAITP